MYCVLEERLVQFCLHRANDKAAPLGKKEKKKIVASFIYNSKPKDTNTTKSCVPEASATLSQHNETTHNITHHNTRLSRRKTASSFPR